MIKENPYLRQFVALAFVSMIVVSGGFANYAQPAKAAGQCEDATQTIIGFVADAGGTLANCMINFYATGYGDAANESLSTAETSWQESARNSKANTNLYEDTYKNYLNSMKGRSRGLALDVYVQELENGSSRAAAETTVNSTIADYYAAQQIQLIEHNNEQVRHMLSLSNSMENHPNASPNDYWNQRNIDSVNSSTGEATYSSANPSKRIGGTVTRSVTLANGSSYTEVGFYIEGDSTNQKYFTDSPGTWAVQKTTRQSSLSNFMYYEPGKIKWLFDELDSQETTVRKDMQSVLDGTYDSYAQGTINSSDFGRIPALADRWNPSDNFSAWAYSTTLATGGSIPQNPDSLGSMTIDVNGTTYDGILLASGEVPGGSLEVGKTYNTGNFVGPVTIARDTGNMLQPNEGPSETLCGT